MSSSGSVAGSPLDEYFDAIDSYDVERTIAAFTEDALYVRPNLETGALDVVQGHAELRAYLVARGKKPFLHLVRAFVVDGSECFAEGFAVEDHGDRKEIASFLVRATLDEQNKIARYFALMGGTIERGEES